MYPQYNNYIENFYEHTHHLSSATKIEGRNEVKRVSCLATEKAVKYEYVGEDNMLARVRKEFERSMPLPSGELRASLTRYILQSVLSKNTNPVSGEATFSRIYMPRVT